MYFLTLYTWERSLSALSETWNTSKQFIKSVSREADLTMQTVRFWHNNIVSGNKTSFSPHKFHFKSLRKRLQRQTAESFVHYFWNANVVTIKCSNNCRSSGARLFPLNTSATTSSYTIRISYCGLTVMD